ncbi:glycoside hydrolase family 9 protein [Pseudobacteroides cellulosolvens]|nr:glycoside hydrolase family 9 protein [Pseudobacteroides cellulosolvens]
MKQIKMKAKRLFSLLLVLVMTSGVIPIHQSAALVSAAGSYNYGEALQKAIMFYEFQLAGKQPDWIRNNWRGDAVLNDGKDVGADLSKGWFDAGDHVKFNLPMSYSVAMLAWSIYEYKDAFKKSGQLDYLLREMKWATDYFINCHPEPNVYYFEVGHGGGMYDHKYWGAAETVEQAMKDLKLERVTYKADLNKTATTCVASTSAAMAAASIVFKESDPQYAATLLEHAKELLDFADQTKSTDQTKSESAYAPVANDFYKSWSGCYDQLSWAATWLYLATGDQSYIEKAESYVPNWEKTQDGTIAYKWGHNWDNVLFGTQILLARITNKAIYKESTERNLDWWTVGYKGERIQYTPKGLAWLDTWGCLRYATTTAFLAEVYSDWAECSSEKAGIYREFAKAQVDYCLGSSGRSYVIGYGTGYPEHPHHRTAQGSWSDDKTVPGYTRHTIVGALIGGPDKTDKFTDDAGKYEFTEVACDYNAGFVGVLAKMYQKYGGDPIPNFNAIEEVREDEYFVEASVSSGSNFAAVKSTLRNRSAWPAKVLYDASFRYFVDLTELVEKGIKPEDIKVTLGYSEGAQISGLLPWDSSKNIYYANITFVPGSAVYPGGQSAHRREVQFRIEAPIGTTGWDNTNDFSFNGISSSGTTLSKAPNIPVYNEGKLLAGNEPKGNSTATPTPKVTIPPVSGYIDADFSYLAANSSKIKSGFKVEIKGSDLSAITDENGYFKINNIPLEVYNKGTYELVISKKNYLTRTYRLPIVDLPLGSDNDLERIFDAIAPENPIKIWVGDMEKNGIQDGAINMSDIIEIAKVFNSISGDSKYDGDSDFTKDGSINMADVIVVAKHFNATNSSYPQ